MTIKRKAKTREQLDFQKKLDKLPKWVRDHFKTISMQRDAAVKALDRFTDRDTKSPFFIEDYICDGTAEGRGPTNRRSYVQCYKMHCDHAGVQVTVLLRDDNIEISWDGSGRHGDDIVMQPKSWQMISIFQPGAKKQR